MDSYTIQMWQDLWGGLQVMLCLILLGLTYVYGVAAVQWIKNSIEEKKFEQENPMPGKRQEDYCIIYCVFENPIWDNHQPRANFVCRCGTIISRAKFEPTGDVIDCPECKKRYVIKMANKRFARIKEVI